jgi:hypothetical protein
MSRTTLKRWATAIALDVLITGGFAVAAVYGSADVHYWATTVIGTMIIVSCLIVTALAALTLLSWSNTDEPKTDEEFANSLSAIYAPKFIEQFAMSKAFENYHVLTECILIVLLLLTGHWILAILRTITAAGYAVIMTEARARQIESSDQPSISLEL